jgi:tetratricopeptide (TPR) repeat protein
MREDLLAALRARLRRIDETGDPAPALDAAAGREARQLADLLGAPDEPGDLPVRRDLGRLYWLRHTAAPPPAYEGQARDEGAAAQDRTDLEAAVEILIPCFLVGYGDLPEPLLPRLADAARPYALGLLQQALGSGDADLHAFVAGVWRRMVAATADDDPDLGDRRSALALVLRGGYELTRDRAELDEAIGLLRAAVREASAGHPALPGRLSNLGLALADRYDATGDAADLEDAVAAAREAVRAAPADHPSRGAMLTNAGLALRRRYDRGRAVADLDEAVDLFRSAARATAAMTDAAAPPDAPATPHAATTPAAAPARAAHATPAASAAAAAARSQHLTHLTHLGSALRTRYGRTHDAADLDEAVATGREALRVAPPGHPDRVVLLGNLAAALSDRSGSASGSAHPADLEEALGHLGAALAADPATGHRATLLANLGGTLRQRHVRTGDPADLERAVDAWREALALTPRDDPARPRRLTGLSHALRRRYGGTGDAAGLADLRDAVTAAGEAVALAPAGHPERAESLAELAIVLRLRFERAGDPADLDRAVAAGEESVAALPEGHAARAGHLSGLGIALRARAVRTGSRADLDRAVAVGRQAVRATPESDPARAGRLSNLGLALRERFERTGDRTDLDDAVARGQEAVAALRAEDRDGPAVLSNLAVSVRERFVRTGDRADLDTAVDHFRRALRAVPPGRPGESERTDYLANLGAALVERFDRTGEDADLDEALRRLRDAEAATPADHPQRARRLSTLGTALLSHFERTDGEADLDDALERLRDAVAATSADHPERALHLANLGLALRTRFERTGDSADADAAVAAGTDAVRATPEGHTERPGRLSNAATALLERFGRFGRPADLDGAVGWLRAAVQATAPDHPERARHLSNLGLALRERFEHGGDPADADAAVAAGREALAALPGDHPGRAAARSNLGATLFVRALRRAGAPGGGPGATPAGGAARAGVSGTGPQALDAPVAPSRVAGSSVVGPEPADRGLTGAQPTDLDEAVDHLRAAVEDTAEDHPDRTGRLFNLGGALRARYLMSGGRGDLDAAVSAYTRAYRAGSGPPSLRIEAARAAAALLEAAATADGTAGHRAAGAAADAAEAAVRLLPEAAPRALGSSDQQHALARFTGLAGTAAALALADPGGTPRSRATRALRLLEAGRAVLLSQALDTRGDLAELTERRPDLAAAFVRLRAALDRPVTGDADLAPARGSEPGAAGAARRPAGPDRHRQAREFAGVLAEIRALDGLEGFGLPPTTDELLAEAARGPVVTFTTGPRRGDALLLTADGIASLELPLLTPDALAGHIASFHRALEMASDADADRAARRAAQAAMLDTLGWLWDAAAGPVLQELGHRTEPAEGAEWPRVWWVPGGPLALLPLHAAGHHTDAADGRARRTVMDRVVSSYTPTVRALRHARRPARPAPRTAADRALVVAMPSTPGLPGGGRLDHVPAEVEALHRHLPRAVLLREPEPADGDGPSAPGPAGAREPAAASAPTSAPTEAALPTKAAVLAELGRCAVAHFACHGDSHPTDPSRSLLLLHDHATDPLTVADLAPVRLDHARLAYLSACRTAARTAALVDEAVHLTSAFQLAGFPHVVGTLWEIDDEIAVTAADAFYTRLRAPSGSLDPGRSARALHQAVRALRDGDDLPAGLDRVRVPYLWAAYLHAGA